MAQETGRLPATASSRGRLLWLAPHFGVEIKIYTKNSEAWKAVRSLLAVVGIVACLESLRRNSNTKQETQRRETPYRAQTAPIGP